MTITIDKLENLFGAEAVNYQPTSDENTYLDKRSQVERNTTPFLSIEQYLYYYDLFCNYGLEDLMLQKLEGEIRYWATHQRQLFLESEFYQRFKDKPVVNKYVATNK